MEREMTIEEQVAYVLRQFCSDNSLRARVRGAEVNWALIHDAERILREWEKKDKMLRRENLTNRRRKQGNPATCNRIR